MMTSSRGSRCAQGRLDQVPVAVTLEVATWRDRLASFKTSESFRHKIGAVHDNHKERRLNLERTANTSGLALGRAVRRARPAAVV